jgi:hypothetical protein
LGAPSSIEERKSHDKVMSFLKIAYGNLNIIESGPINRKALPALLTSMGIFVHAFQGSLDKALLEATLMCNPVATVNIGYLKIFGPWSRSKSKDEKQFIIDEITAIQGHNLEKLSQELIRRRNLVLKNHTLESWLTKVTGLMKEE